MYIYTNVFDLKNKVNSIAKLYDRIYDTNASLNYISSESNLYFGFIYINLCAAMELAIHSHSYLLIY